MLGPRDAVALLSVFGRLDGVNEITFEVKDGTRKMVLEVAAGPTLLQRMWDELDATMNSLKNDAPGSPELNELKVRARAQAEFIAMFMVPHFRTANEVAKEAMRRYQARQGGDKEYETPGLGTRRFEPPPGVNKYAPTPKNTPKKAAVAAPKVKNTKPLPDKAKPGVALALKSGKFTKQQLATMYGVSIETIEAVELDPS